MAASYLNFSAFLARLLAAGVVETTSLCALTSSEFGRSSPTAKATASHADADAAAREYEPYAAAAAQWIVQGGPALYEMCVKDVVFQIGRKKWTLALWESWKTKFEAVSKDDRYSSPTREMAKQALEKMAILENEGVANPGIISKFNPAISNDMEEEEEDEDEDEE